MSLERTLLSRPWPPRGVADVQNLDQVSSDPIENLVRISQYQHGADMGPADDQRCAQRMVIEAVDDVLDTPSNRLGNAGISDCAVERADPLKVPDRAQRIDDCHALRNFANAAFTSASLATSPLSSCAMASSIARSSSSPA